jgi:hypothetical protein
MSEDGDFQPQMKLTKTTVGKIGSAKDEGINPRREYEGKLVDRSTSETAHSNWMTKQTQAVYT